MPSAQLPDPAPLLQPPGAGLPLPQRLAIRLFFGPVASRLTPAPTSRQRYELATARLIAMVDATEPAHRKLKILVPPQPGLEDSSRYWSLDGVVEHVLIVSKGIEQVILSLAAGKVPPGEADIAAVKPRQLEGDPLPELKAYAPALFARLDEKLREPGMSLALFAAPARFRHPWFGMLTARQWYWVLASHQAIHARQARAIFVALKNR